MKAFGPIPSRRLGFSLGINNIPPKRCTYHCIYCQVGRTTHLQIERAEYYVPEELVRDVKERIEQVKKAGGRIDSLTFVPDGEPTLDIHLGREIELLKPLGIQISVLTNSSLIWREDVREDLKKADWVSLKIDSVQEDIWRKIDHPHQDLKLSVILNGMLQFSKIFKGELVTETMLVKGVNDTRDSVRQTADFLGKLQPSKAYLLIPTRPPAEKNVQPADEAFVNWAFQCVRNKVAQTEHLIGYEGNDFNFSGHFQNDLLNVTAVHPMRRDAVEELLARAKSDWSAVQKLIDEGKLVETEYEGSKFYMRRFGDESRVNR